MVIRIGTTFMGEVDAVGTQSIQTKFFVLGVPLFPLGSFYFTSPGRGIEIPLHGKSVLAGYLRLGLWLGAVLLVIRLFVISSWRRDASDWITAFVVLGLAIASIAVLGRLNKEEKARRMVLLARTGIGADPSVLPGHMQKGIESDLLARLAEKELPVDAAAWAQAAASNAAASASADAPYRASEARFDAAAWGDAYAYARYAAVHTPAWRNVLPALWSNVVA